MPTFKATFKQVLLTCVTGWQKVYLWHLVGLKVLTDA